MRVTDDDFCPCLDFKPTDEPAPIPRKTKKRKRQRHRQRKQEDPLFSVRLARARRTLFFEAACLPIPGLSRTDALATLFSYVQALVDVVSTRRSSPEPEPESVESLRLDISRTVEKRDEEAVNGQFGIVFPYDPPARLAALVCETLARYQADPDHERRLPEYNQLLVYYFDLLANWIIFDRSLLIYTSWLVDFTLSEDLGLGLG